MLRPAYGACASFLVAAALLAPIGAANASAGTTPCASGYERYGYRMRCVQVRVTLDGKASTQKNSPARAPRPTRPACRSAAGPESWSPTYAGGKAQRSGAVWGIGCKGVVDGQGHTQAFRLQGRWSNERQCYVAPAPKEQIRTVAGVGTAMMEAFLDRKFCQGLREAQARTVWQWRFPMAVGTPEQAAHDLVVKLGLQAVHIRMSPEPRGDVMPVVGVPVWLWAQREQGSTELATREVDSNGYRLRVTPRLESVEWNLGDGTTVPCADPAWGTPFVPGRGAEPSPSGCGHTYQRSSADRPGNTYTVTATSHWVVRWEVVGGDALPAAQRRGEVRVDDLVAQRQVPVGEIQVLITHR